MALVYTPDSGFGSPCPDFSLPGVDGRTHALAEYKNGKPLAIMFICNHCPYVKAVEDRLVELGRDLKPLGVNLVAICSNDAVSHPEDSFEAMAARSKEKTYTFPYLHDETQATAKTFGAVCTPDFFVYDKDLKLRYRGRLDDSWKNPALVSKRELLDAVRTLLEGRTIEDQTPSMGCSIKWK